MSLYGLAISDDSQDRQYLACSQGVWTHPYYHKCYDCKDGPETCPIGQDLLLCAYARYKNEVLDKTPYGCEPNISLMDWFTEYQKAAHNLRHNYGIDVSDVIYI